MKARWQQVLFSGWHFMRWLRLVSGTFFLVAAVLWQDWLLGLTALFLLFQALTTIGCCSVNSCFVNTARRKGSTDGITFEEV